LEQLKFQKSTRVRDFVLSRKTELLLTLYVPLYLIAFFLIEKLLPDSGYWVTWLPLDDLIPFWEGGAIFYVLWFPFLIGTGLFLFFFDAPAYRRFLTFMSISFTAAVVICCLFPNGQELRPLAFEHDNVLTQFIAHLYAFDTNTNVFPSVHVIGSLMAMNAWFDSAYLRRFRWAAAALAILICASTVLIKQHSALDVIGGVGVCIPVWCLVYGKRFSRSDR
jgi:membrane-associated phospholipid phosphatase